jgi:catechol 2,3-dioxygenase-like lactoylglutathione lyase family enzyme
MSSRTAVVGFTAMRGRPHRAHGAVVLLFAAFWVPLAAQSTENPLQLKPHHATAAVADVDRAVRWYQEMLGFKVVTRGERPNGMRFADLEMPASPSRDAASASQGFGIGLVQNPGVASSSSNRGGSGWLHIVFSVPDPARAFATLKARGANVSTRGNPSPAEITTFLLHDSEGNEIEIVQEH